MMPATVLAARMWDLTASLPNWRLLVPWLVCVRGAQGPVGYGRGGLLSDNDERPTLVVLHQRRYRVHRQ